MQIRIRGVYDYNIDALIEESDREIQLCSAYVDICKILPDIKISKITLSREDAKKLIIKRLNAKYPMPVLVATTEGVHQLTTIMKSEVVKNG
jgi:hypothetical protein